MIRIGKEKVRTGCITCKRRRVKCDEGRPSCNRCSKAGKPCEGYANGVGSGRGEPLKIVVYSPHNTLTTDTLDLDWSERRALSFFQDRTARELAGSFETDFWLANILPLARQEKSVKHALIALSSMHEHFSGVDHFAPTGIVDYALSHYGKAIREVVGLSHSQVKHTTEYALITCALFAALESLQGNYHAACKHAVSGIKILAEEERSLVSARQGRMIPREVLTRFFLSMERQLLEIGDANFQGPQPQLQGLETTLPNFFTSHEEALSHMEFLLRNIFFFAERMDSLGTSGPVSEDTYFSLVTEFQRIRAQIDGWTSAFDHLPETTKPTPTGSSRRAPGILILRVHQVIMTAFLARMQRNDDAVLNEFLPEFWSALDDLDEFIQSTSSFVTPMLMTPTTTTTTTDDPLSPQSQKTMARPTFSLSLGIVPSLFFIASRTSDPAMRTRALHLLTQCNRREGLWDSRLAARVVERIDVLTDFARRQQERQQPWARGPVPCPSELRPPPTPEFKLIDIKFLPGRKCSLRYKFITPRGFGLDVDVDVNEEIHDDPGVGKAPNQTTSTCDQTNAIEFDMGLGLEDGAEAELFLDREYLEILEWEGEGGTVSVDVWADAKGKEAEAVKVIYPVGR